MGPKTVILRVTTIHSCGPITSDAGEAGGQQPREEVRLSFLSGIATYTLQLLMSVHQSAIGGPVADFVRPRFGLSADSLAEGISQRLSWMVPLIDEAIELASEV